jgi:hypothetical protein
MPRRSPCALTRMRWPHNSHSATINGRREPAVPAPLLDLDRHARALKMRRSRRNQDAREMSFDPIPVMGPSQ